MSDFIGTIIFRVAAVGNEPTIERRPASYGRMVFKMATVFLGAGILCSQPATSPPLPEFEAVSIKPHGAAFDPPSLQVGPARVTGVNISLSQLILDAYGLQYFQLAKEDWLDEARFDISAVAQKPEPRATLLAMLQPVLSSRFKLMVHRETRDIPVYRLVVAKGGSKVPPADEEQHLSIRPASDGAMQLTGKTRMKDFADLVGGQTDRPAVDATGLEGLFDFKLTYTYERRGHVELPPGAVSIFQALEQQLGLKLEPAKAPTEILVVDHAEKTPVEN